MLVVAVSGAGVLWVGSAKGLTPVGSILVGVLGIALIAASLVVGVQSPKPNQQGSKRTRGGFLGAAPREAPRLVVRRELEHVVKALEGADGRAVGLVGMGGAGKTVLAAEVVHHEKIRRFFGDGVAWLTVGPHADVLALQSDLAGRLGSEMAAFRDAGEGRNALAKLLDEQRVLIVLDNVWERAVPTPFRPAVSCCLRVVPLAWCATCTRRLSRWASRAGAGA